MRHNRIYACGDSAAVVFKYREGVVEARISRLRSWVVSKYVCVGRNKRYLYFNANSCSVGKGCVGVCRPLVV